MNVEICEMRGQECHEPPVPLARTVSEGTLAVNRWLPPVAACASWNAMPDEVSSRFALLCGHGRVEPYEPHMVCLIKFGDGFP